MSNEEGTYAPKSPDLSSLFSGSAAPSEPPPTSSGTGFSYQAPASYGGQHQPPPPPPPQQHTPPETAGGPGFGYMQYGQYPPQASGPQPYYSTQPPAPYGQFAQAPYGLPAGPGQPQPYYAPYPESQPTRYQPPQPPAPHDSQIPAGAQHQVPNPDPYNAMPPRGAAIQAPPEPVIMESPVRTKFPTARIKRIMQADEEVGKVAQQTPIAVGKALELFMVQIVTKSADVAKEKNSKRITAQMLKQAVDLNNEWDFLREIVSKVGEEKEGSKSAGKAKAESDSEEDFDAGEAKKKARGGRKKKAA